MNSIPSAGKKLSMHSKYSCVAPGPPWSRRTFIRGLFQNASSDAHGTVDGLNLNELYTCRLNPLLRVSEVGLQRGFIGLG